MVDDGERFHPLGTRSARRPRRELALLPLIALVALVAGSCGTAQPSGPQSTADLSPNATSSSTPSGTPSGSPTPSPSPSPSPTPIPTTPPPDLARLRISTEPFAKVDGPALAMVADPAGNRLLVADQRGRVWSVGPDGAVDRDPVMDIRKAVTSGGERGLLGIALHPDYPSDTRLFVDYTDTGGDTVVASLELLPARPGVLGAGDLRQVLFVHQPYSNHNGGGLHFGPDGRLYVALGDGGSGGDPQGNGQNPDVLLGKILRLDIDAPASTGYAIPADNPLANGGGRPEVWLLGLRNPWRFSFDRLTGDLWLGDVGQSAWEEVDVVRAGAGGGENLGWNVMEGAHCYDAVSCDAAGLMLPVAEYGHDVGCAIVGGYVYRGSRYPFLVGAYLFSDTCTSHVWAIDAGSDGPSTPVRVGQVAGNVASFGEDADGELYVLTLGGTVERLVAAQG